MPQENNIQVQNRNDSISIPVRLSQVNQVSERLVNQHVIQQRYNPISTEGIGGNRKSCRYPVNVEIRVPIKIEGIHIAEDSE